MNLNEVADNALENAKRREMNGANIKHDTQNMLKHCAGEVVEVTQAFTEYDLFRQNVDDMVRKEEYKEGFASELAGIICCVLIVSANEGIDIEKAVSDCLQKNARRANKEGDKL